MNPVGMSDSGLRETVTASIEEPLVCTRAEALDELVRRATMEPGKLIYDRVTAELTSLYEVAYKHLKQLEAAGVRTWDTPLFEIRNGLAQAMANLNGWIACA